jgi:hypothetical protein
LNLKRRVVLKRILKKEKKTKPYLLTFRPKRPSGPSPITPHRPASPSLFFFSFAVADTWAPLVSLSISPFLSSSLCLAVPPPQPRGSRRAPPSPLPFSPQQACQLRHLIAQARLGLFPLSLHRAVTAAAINAKRRPESAASLRLPPCASI